MPGLTAEEVAGCGVMGFPLEVEKRGLPLLVGEWASVCFLMRTFFGGDVLLDEVFFWLAADDGVSCCGIVVDGRDLVGGYMISWDCTQILAGGDLTGGSTTVR